MSELAKELRNLAHYAEGCCTDDQPDCTDIMRRAADEIERLRTLITESCDDINWYAARAVDLSGRTPVLDKNGGEYRIRASDQHTWADALQDEINELRWAANPE